MWSLHAWEEMIARAGSLPASISKVTIVIECSLSAKMHAQALAIDYPLLPIDWRGVGISLASRALSSSPSKVMMRRGDLLPSKHLTRRVKASFRATESSLSRINSRMDVELILSDPVTSSRQTG